MPKFSGSGTKTRPPAGPTMTTGQALTHESGTGWEKDAKSALYTLGVTNMVSEPTFYEAADTRDNRFRDLVAQVTSEDPQWMQGFIPWLRNAANMRSAPVVAALEYAHAGGPNARAVIDSAMSRADEPAEALGYWLHCHGRKLPMAVKRGIADAACRLYTQNAAIKYDGSSRGVRMGDVVELTHPNPHRIAANDDDVIAAEIERRLDELGDYTAEHAFSVRDNVMREAEEGRIERIARVSTLFHHLLNRRHGTFEANPDSIESLRAHGLKRLAATYEIDSIAPDDRRAFLRDHGPAELADSGFTWERLSGWLPGGMDAEAWEAIIPSMGYMALLRNLRNFEKANVNEAVLRQVADKLADPDEVARSRQFPYRFLSAYLNSGTTYFAPALEKALDLSLQNVPIFPGRTLVLVDTSASMTSPVSQRSAIKACDIGALFAVAVAAHSKVDFVIYATSHAAIDRLPTSVLRGTELVQRKIGSVGHGTETWPAALAHYNGQDRIVVFTDCQDHPSRAHEHLPDVPIYVWDLNGYATTNVNLIEPGRYCFGGFSDSAFRLISLIEAGQDAGWPWEA